jgi:hypothetical protein
MSDAVAVAALVVAGLNATAAALGAWRWYRGEASRAFWPLLRIAQGGAVVLAGLAAVLGATGRSADDELFYVYALTPIAVGLIAEQLRLASAETVLESRGLRDARDVGELPEREQRSVVLQIVRRELGVMTLSAAVVAFLAVRAWGTASGF